MQELYRFWTHIDVNLLCTDDRFRVYPIVCEFFHLWVQILNGRNSFKLISVFCWDHRFRPLELHAKLVSWSASHTEVIQWPTHFVGILSQHIFNLAICSLRTCLFLPETTICIYRYELERRPQQLNRHSYYYSHCSTFLCLYSEDFFRPCSHARESTKELS